MTIKKRILSFIFLLIITFVSITGVYFNTSVYAEGLTDYGTLFATFTKLVGANDDVPINVLDSLVFDALCPRDAGIIVRTVSRINYELTKKCIATYLNNKYSNQDKNKDNITQSDINEFSRDFEQNINYSDESTTYNNNSRSMLNLFINETLNTSPSFYVYSYVVNTSATSFPEGTLYNALKTVLDTTDKNYINILYQYNNNYYLLTSNNTDIGFVYFSSWNNNPRVKFYSYSSWDQISYFDKSIFTQYKYVSGSFVENTDNLTLQNNSSNPVLSMIANSTVSGLGNGWDGIAYFVNRDSSHIFKVFRSYDDFRASSVGQSSFYVNNSVYNDWSTSTGDYTVTTDNSNKASYGDITSYIDSFNTENGRYPSDQEIFHWIEDYTPTVNPTPTPDPDNPSGTGSFVNNNNPSITNNPTFNNNPNINITLFPSVSDNGLNGGTVSGNGGQGSIGNIFEWIGNLGNVIANLIKNVGEMIVNAFQGVIEAVTTILNGIPNILTPIIEFVFGGLPDELQALISLGITCIIFVGIIKVIKR